MQVDHIVPVRLNPRRAFDPKNLQTLCMTCHRVKDARLPGDGRRGYSLDVGADGQPVDPRHPWHTT